MTIYHGLGKKALANLFLPQSLAKDSKELYLSLLKIIHDRALLKLQI